MIPRITSENDLITMDDKDYSKHMLSIGDEKLPLGNTSSCHTSTTILSADDSAMEGGEVDEFLCDDAVRGVPTVDNTTSGAVDKKPAAIDVFTKNKSVPMDESDINKGSNNKGEEDGADDPSSKNDSLPGKFDILCGQSRICASHTGNRRFQVVLDMNASRYSSVTSKQEKMTLTKQIVASIQNSGGRFLKYQDGVWIEISDVTARDKVSHALRTKMKSRTRQMEQAEQQQQQQQQQQEVQADKLPSSSSSPAGSVSSRPSNRKPRPTHRRRSNVPRKRRSSSNSIATSASDIATSSFDANNSASSSVMEELLRSQREIFAVLTKDAEKNGGEIHPLKKE